MDNLFIQALARAASCHEHARQIATLRDVVPYTHHKTRRRDAVQHERREYKSTKADGPLKRARRFAEKELKALVDYYGIDLEPRPEDTLVDDGPLVWNVGDDHEPWPVKEEQHNGHIEKLQQLLKNEETPHQDIFDCYKLLPSPGVVYLTTRTIRDLLQHLSIVEHATEISMQRFLSILDDMKTAHIHIIRSEWTTAIYFASRCMGKVTADDVQSALYLWRDMEQRAGVMGGIVTLNVLFDMAVKAGKYTLADTFIKEVQARKLKFHRHFRVSLLYFYGVMQDGNAVRRTYQELVSAGDIVDTVVMNSVIAALIRAGEPAAAEHVFERMKRLHASKTSPRLSPGNWRERRLFGLHLTYEAQKIAAAGTSDKLKELQDEAPITPDTRTYGLIIRHHASTAGDIDRVQQLLKEMEYNKIPIDGTIFIVILYGFNSYGGIRYSSWTRDKLETIWAQYLQAVQDGMQRTWFSSMAVIAALKAFKKCTNDERVLQAWEQARRAWNPSPEETDQVLQALRRLVPEHTFFDWDV
jgi:pentatricopeptide repeat protein